MTGERLECELAFKRQQLANAKPRLLPRGTCHFCDEAVADAEQKQADGTVALLPRLFCNIECSKDWEKHHGRR